MPNRILREGILTSERVERLNWAEEVFYRRLMSVVDDFGRYYARPSLILAACYPLLLKKVSDSDIEKWLSACETAALVRVYPASDGKRYLQLLDFKQQQRAAASKYPQPPDECAADATQPPGTPPAAAHLDVSVDVSEDDKGARPFVLPEWIPKDTWAAYLKTRAGKKAKNEPQALGLIVKDLEAFKAKGHDPVTVLNNSIKGGWAGVFEPKTSPGEVRSITVPPPANAGEALRKLEADKAVTTPPPAHIREQLKTLARGVH